MTNRAEKPSPMLEPVGALHPNDLRSWFLGVDTLHPVVGGQWLPRAYLDSAATSLLLEPALIATRELLAHGASSHSTSHHGSQLASEALRWAEHAVLDFLGADPDQYAVLWTGSGATVGLNLLASGLAGLYSDLPLALVSAMEHHSNDLPHRRYCSQVIHFPLRGFPDEAGCVDVPALLKLLEEHSGKVRYVAFSAASNVTGMLNPVDEMVRAAHAHGTLAIVDGTQAVSHHPITLSHSRAELDPDAFVFSGHKIYAPMSPGVVVMKRALLEKVPPTLVGGGAVLDVTRSTYTLSASPTARHQPGTPSISGAMLLGNALSILRKVGMKRVQASEQELLAYAIERLSKLDGVTVYGDKNLERTPRVGAIAFNASNLSHALVAAVLNDYFAVAVRNACFCAHPYVRELLKRELWSLEYDTDDAESEERIWNERRGMVRASLGIYSTRQDVDRLIAGLQAVLEKPDYFRSEYELFPDNTFRHRSFVRGGAQLFDPAEVLHRTLQTWSFKAAE